MLNQPKSNHRMLFKSLVSARVSHSACAFLWFLLTGATFLKNNAKDTLKTNNPNNPCRPGA